MDPSVRLVVIGPTRTDRIQELATIWGQRLTIASQKPWLAGVHGRGLTDQLDEFKDLTRTHGELIEENTDVFVRVVSRLIRRRGLRGL